MGLVILRPRNCFEKNIYVSHVTVVGAVVGPGVGLVVGDGEGAVVGLNVLHT